MLYLLFVCGYATNAPPICVCAILGVEMNTHVTPKPSFGRKKNTELLDNIFTMLYNNYINETVHKEEKPMPKIILHLREQLLLEAKKQLLSNGYSGLAIRSVAQACGVGIGTVYNYFPSKEMLVGACIYEDWKVYLAQIEALPTDLPRQLLCGIYDALRSFSGEYAFVFQRHDAVKQGMVGFFKHHKTLRSQLSAPLLPMCEQLEIQDPAFAADFMAEALIRWAMEGVAFDRVYALLEKIMQ